MEFKRLDALQRRLREVKRLHSTSLSSYFVSTKEQGVGFRHLWDEEIPVNPKEKAYSHASTATCVASLTNTGAWWHDDKEVAGGKRWRDYTEALLAQMCTDDPRKWTSAGLLPGNPFTVAFSLEGIRELHKGATYADTSLPSKVKDVIAKAEALLIRNLTRKQGKPRGPDQFAQSGAAHIAFYPPTSFLTQLVVRSLAKEKLEPVRYQVEDWCRRQIEHELALLNAPSNLHDPLSLAYAVSAFLALAQLDNLSPLDVLLIKRAVDSFFAAQLPDGSWPRSKPLHHYPKFGNAYCYEYETLVQLLQARHIQSQLIENLERLELCIDALDRTANVLPNGGRAWPSGHHPHLHGAESWSTASAYQFVHHLDRLVAEALRVTTFAYVGSAYTKPNETKTEKDEFKPHGFLDSRFSVDGVETTLTATVQDDFLRPILNEIHQLIRGEALSKETPVSAILYGPPGTSKTDLAKLIASHLGWPRLDIDPSHLFRQGLEQLQSESNRLFEMIASLERTVVFFDEFDEMVRERTSERADLMSRFLTTAMLPKLSRIADKRQIVFLLATNHIEDFDFAISRPGRFDMLLPVMPPSLDAKLNALKWQSIKPAIIPLLDEEMTCFDGETTLPIREVLEALTFAEYKALYSKSKELTDPDQLRGQVAAAWDRATLNKPSYGVPNETREASGLLYRFYLSQAKEHSRVLKPKIN